MIAPVGTRADPADVAVDQLPFAKRTNLAIDDLRHPDHVFAPVPLRVPFSSKHAATITHQNCAVTLPGGFQTQVVVHPAIDIHNVDRNAGSS